MENEEDELSWLDEYSPDKTADVVSSIQGERTGQSDPISHSQIIEQAEQELDDRTDRSGAIGAVGRGAAQGASFGLADEATASALALYGLANGEKDLSKLYKQYRDEQRTKNKQASQKYPIAYGASELAGGIATSLPLPGGVAGLAAQGGVNALGHSDSDTISGDLENTAIGAGIGAATGKAFETGSKLINKLRQPAAQADSIPFDLSRQLPKVPEKGELDITNDVIQHESKNKEVQDRIAAFRKRKANDINYRLKSDELAKDMFGMDPVEGGYNPAIDDITVPPDKRQLFGVGESEIPYSKMSEEQKMLMGDRPMPKQSKPPSILQAVPPLKEAPSSPGDKLVNVLNTQPTLLGPYAKPLKEAQSRSPKALSAIVYTLASRDAGFRKLWQDLNNTNEEINADNLE